MPGDHDQPRVLQQFLGHLVQLDVPHADQLAGAFGAAGDRRQQLAEQPRFAQPILDRIFFVRSVLVDEHDRQGGHHGHDQVPLVVGRQVVRRERHFDRHRQRLAGLRLVGVEQVLERRPPAPLAPAPASRSSTPLPGRPRSTPLPHPGAAPGRRSGFRPGTSSASRRRPRRPGRGSRRSTCSAGPPTKHRRLESAAGPRTGRAESSRASWRSAGR